MIRYLDDESVLVCSSLGPVVQLCIMGDLMSSVSRFLLQAASKVLWAYQSKVSDKFGKGLILLGVYFGLDGISG